jgi:hypothetical protein
MQDFDFYYTNSFYLSVEQQLPLIIIVILTMEHMIVVTFSTRNQTILAMMETSARHV